VWSSGYNLAGPTSVAAHKQSAWDKDKPVIASERVKLTNSLNSVHGRQGAAAGGDLLPHSGDWLYALPLSSCGLRLDDSAMHIAVGLRLSANICEPFQCPCGTMVDAKGTQVYGLSHIKAISGGQQDIMASTTSSGERYKSQHSRNQRTVWSTKV